MFDIRNSQRSFNNSWLLHDHADIPSGVIVDISVVTPIEGDVYVAKLTADGEHLAISLKQGDREIAYMRTNTTGNPVLMDSDVPGVWASVVLGYIPENLFFVNNHNAHEPECIISPEIVTYFDYVYLAATGNDSVIVIPPNAPIPWDGPIDIIIDPGLDPSLDYPEYPGYPTLKLDIDPTNMPTHNFGIDPRSGGLYKINGVPIEPPNYEGPNIVIKYNGEPLDVAVYNNVVVLTAPDLDDCMLEDVIDNYIGPEAGNPRVLDECYTCDVPPKRDTVNRLSNESYGFSRALRLTDIDTAFDSEVNDGGSN